MPESSLFARYVVDHVDSVEATDNRLCELRQTNFLEIRGQLTLRDRPPPSLLLNQLGHQAGPAGLMTCAQTCAGVALEILVEKITLLIGRTA